MNDRGTGGIMMRSSEAIYRIVNNLASIVVVVVVERTD